MTIFFSLDPNAGVPGEFTEAFANYIKAKLSACSADFPQNEIQVVGRFPIVSSKLSLNVTIIQTVGI